MASLNKVMVIGNLGTDPEMRFTPQRKSGNHFFYCYLVDIHYP